MVLKSVTRDSSFIPLSHTYLHVLTSSLTVGLGGSAGLEAPIVATGAATGSNLARISEMNYPERTLLISCGAAAGIAAVFNAPIAGVIFAIEILMTEAVVSYFIPLIISSVVGALCSHIILKESILFNFVLQESFNYANVPFYILLGVMCGLVSRYYARAFMKVEALMHRWNTGAYTRALTAGLLLVLLFLFLPPLFGEGYGTIIRLANNHPQDIDLDNPVFGMIVNDWRFLVLLTLVMLAKPIAAGLTIGGGGNGGNFAPSLFVGAILGYVFSRVLNMSGWFRLPEGNFTLVGMAGMLSGIMYAPLTAIFLIAEITNGYELFIPLMIVSAISYFMVRHYARFSMDMRRLVAEGHSMRRRKEHLILSSIRLADMLEPNYATVGIDKDLGDLVEIIKRSEKNIYAVVDEKGELAGLVELNDIKHLIFQPHAYARTAVRKIMKKPPDIISVDEPMQKVMQRFDLSRSWYLPVVDRDRKFVGFLSKSRLFNKYRELLAGEEPSFE
jgi:CIC family chloride channel protein